MRNIWFISDTHFWHSNILKFQDDKRNYIRNFGSVVEMNEYMVQEWNKRVKPEDHIWHLGDVSWRYDGALTNIMQRLNGHKRVLIGNHDRIKNPNFLKWFEKAELWRGFHEHGFTCTHIPQRLEALRDGNINVHGHIHQNLMDDPHYINVCVEHTNYAPVHMDEILAEIKKRGL